MQRSQHHAARAAPVFFDLGEGLLLESVEGSDALELTDLGPAG